MKIKKLKLDNFVKFTDFEIEFDGKITHLVGINGSGKTTIGLTAIWACLKGIAEKSTNDQLIGDRYRFIGDNKKTAEIELTLFDEEKQTEIKIKNNISKTGNKITFDAPKHYKIDNEWINNLFSVAFISAKNFTARSSKEQAILLGIDTSEFDKNIEDLKKDYTIINRQLRGLGELKEHSKAERVNLSALINEKAKIDEFNFEQKKLFDTINRKQDEIKTYEKQIAELQEKVNYNMTWIEHQKTPESLVDTSDISEKIKNAEEINRKAMMYDNYMSELSKRNALHLELSENKESQEIIKNDRLEYIKSFDFGFKELSINENGELLLNDRPIKEPYFSKGELELIVAKLHAKKNPGLKIRFIDDFELLDEKNQERIISNLIESGFQIITARVGDENKSIGNNTVLLRECKKVDEIVKE